jgi:hypothetical protein
MYIKLEKNVQYFLFYTFQNQYPCEYIHMYVVFMSQGKYGIIFYTIRRRLLWHSSYKKRRLRTCTH